MNVFELAAWSLVLTLVCWLTTRVSLWLDIPLLLASFLVSTAVILIASAVKRPVPLSKREKREG